MSMEGLDNVSSGFVIRIKYRKIISNINVKLTVYSVAIASASIKQVSVKISKASPHTAAALTLFVLAAAAGWKDVRKHLRVHVYQRVPHPVAFTILMSNWPILPWHNIRM